MSKKVPFSLPDYNLAVPSGWRSIWRTAFLRRDYLVGILVASNGAGFASLFLNVRTCFRCETRASCGFCSTWRAVSRRSRRGALSQSWTTATSCDLGSLRARRVQQHWRPRTACHRSNHVLGCTCEKSLLHTLCTCSYDLRQPLSRSLMERRRSRPDWKNHDTRSRLFRIRCRHRIVVKSFQSVSRIFFLQTSRGLSSFLSDDW